MRILADTDRSPGSRRGHWWLRAALLLCGVVVLAAAGLTAALAFSEDLRRSAVARVGSDSPEQLATAFALAPWRFARSFVAPTPVRTIRLDVKFKHLHQIHEQRRAALSSGHLVSGEDHFIPARVTSDSGAFDAQIRIREGAAAALRGQKWPLIVRTRGDAHVLGMRELALVEPVGDDFAPVGLMLDQLRSEEVLAPRSHLAEVVLNGEHLGLMRLLERPAVEMLLDQKRRDGPILRFDSPPETSRGRTSAALSPVRPRAVAASKKLREAFETATGLLSRQLAGKAQASDVFDVETWARFFAVVEVWGAREALAWSNLRFFFNPMTARLEPVALATSLAHRETGDASVLGEDPFAKRLLADPQIAAATQAALVAVAQSMQSPQYALALRSRAQARLRLLHREYPLRQEATLAAVEARAAHFAARSDPATATTATAPPAFRARPATGPLAAQEIETLVARHGFLHWDPDDLLLRVDAGRHEVVGSLDLPEGVGLELSADTVLRFEAGAGLVARGPLLFRGRADAPVVLEGPAAEKRSKRWSGVYVLESAAASEWTHVVVRNTGGFDRPGWSLASGVVFRRTEVSLEDCVFTGDRTDDALNVVRGRFRLANVTITEAASDGFDADFSEGTVDGGLFREIRGDGIDLGGSTAKISGTRFHHIRDKAISVGERSSLTARSLDIERVGIGIASKNGSEVDLRDSTLRRVADVALVAYMNQPEYGPGTLRATSVAISDSALPALAQVGNRLVIDGEPLRPVDAAIDRLYKD